MPNSPFQERELEYDPFDVKETQRESSVKRVTAAVIVPPETPSKNTSMESV